MPERRDISPGRSPGGNDREQHHPLVEVPDPPPVGKPEESEEDGEKLGAELDLPPGRGGDEAALGGHGPPERPDHELTEDDDGCGPYRDPADGDEGEQGAG